MRFPHGNAVRQNQTIIGGNHSAFQSEENTSNFRLLHMWTISNNIGYYIIYDGNSTIFDKHFDEVKNVLSSIAFIKPAKLIPMVTGQKIPFLASRQSIYFSPNDFAKPLSTEQITEVEKNPQSLINKCMSVLDESKDHSDKETSYEKGQLDLCDSIVSHFQTKCRNFNSLLPYCELDVLASVQLGVHSVMMNKKYFLCIILYEVLFKLHRPVKAQIYYLQYRFVESKFEINAFFHRQ